MDKEFTLWDRFEIEAMRDGQEMTVKGLLDYFQVKLFSYTKLSNWREAVSFAYLYLCYRKSTSWK